MFRNKTMTPKMILVGLILLLGVAGLSYAILPRTASLAAPTQQALDSSTVATAAPTSSQRISIPASPMPQHPRIVVTQAATATSSKTDTPTPQTAATPAPQAPVNQVTADYQKALATADALLNGASTPTPPNPPPSAPTTLTGTSEPAPDSASMVLVIVTRTPIPKNIVTVAAQAATATAVATTVGTYTPVPWNWVVPVVIMPQPPTPVPANAATATFQAAEATASAFVYGTPTPAPVYIWTATPTPFMRPVIGDVATPWIAPSPTPTPIPIPQELVGKILFLSNRSGGPQPLSQPLVYVVDADGSNLAVLTDVTFFNTALARDTYSADQRYRAFVKDVIRGQDRAPAIFFYDYTTKTARQVTSFGAGAAWGPAWSPTHEQIVFVSNVSGNDEIWTIHGDGSNARQLTRDNSGFWDKHPSWSVDGSQIVFWSNRSGHRQIWIMDADGSHAHQLIASRYDDWNPIWIKYPDPAREPVTNIGELPSR